MNDGHLRVGLVGEIRFASLFVTDQSRHSKKTPFSAINVRMLWMRVTAQRNVTYF